MHIREYHSIDRNTPCDKCEKVFKNENQIHIHNDGVHTDERIPCDECDKTFKCKSYLAMHIREYHNAVDEKSYLAIYIWGWGHSFGK